MYLSHPIILYGKLVQYFKTEKIEKVRPQLSGSLSNYIASLLAQDLFSRTPDFIIIQGRYKV